jgi:hypothetical protein
VTTCQNIQIKNTKYINNHLERKKSNKSSLELAFFILFDLIIINSTCLFWVRECLASRQTLYSTRHCVCVCVCIGRVAAGAVMDCSWSPWQPSAYSREDGESQHCDQSVARHTHTENKMKCRHFLKVWNDLN